MVHIVCLPTGTYLPRFSMANPPTSVELTHPRPLWTTGLFEQPFCFFLSRFTVTKFDKLCAGWGRRIDNLIQGKRSTGHTLDNVVILATGVPSAFSLGALGTLPSCSISVRVLAVQVRSMASACNHPYRQETLKLV